MRDKKRYSKTMNTIIKDCAKANKLEPKVLKAVKNYHHYKGANWLNNNPLEKDKEKKDKDKVAPIFIKLLEVVENLRAVGDKDFLEPYINALAEKGIKIDINFEETDKNINDIMEVIESASKLQTNVDTLTEELKEVKVHPKDASKEILSALGMETLDNGYNLYTLLKRPQITIDLLVPYLKGEYKKEILDIVEIATKYEGYIAKTYREVDKMLKLESKKIPKDIDYDKVNNLASEARQKLKLVQPETIAQASRISGVNPADISILTVYLKKEYSKDINNE